MIFKKYLKLNTNFQNSINLNLDFNDTKKINNYIPTSTGNHFLSQFLDNVIDKNKDKSTMIIAPYGKGKSHALLVFLNILYRRDYSEINKFIRKVDETDKTLYKKIKQVENKKYLPVIISHTRSNLNQSLSKALENALNENRLNDIKLSTEYLDAIERIEDWKKNYNDTYNKFLEELKNRRIVFEEFKSNLMDFDENALQIFDDIHKKILSGVGFVSTNSLEAVDYYSEIRKVIMDKYNYDGMYIVFDEFSKFLESRDSEHISNDMKIIQDIAELCESFSDNSMYFTIVLHKPINSYRKMDKDVKNAFKGIEGRVAAYYFETNVKNSFELIFNAVKKTDDFKQLKEKNNSINRKIIDNINNIPAFTSIFETNYLYNEFVDYCYPLHPITLYLLIRINEKVAQNERTLFTFLIKKSKYSFSKIIENDYPYSYILPSVIYDYFEKIFSSEEDNEIIHKLLISSKTALNMTDDVIEKEFIKALALVLMINEKDYLPSSRHVLQSSLMINEQKCSEIVRHLEQKNIVIERPNRRIEFKINMDIDIQSEIDNIFNTKFSNLDVPKEMNAINQHKYIYPKMYNITNSITRYYKVDYINEKDFLSLENVNYWFEHEIIDGLIFNIIRSEKNMSDRINKKVMEINNNRLIVIYPDKCEDYELRIRKLKAIEYYGSQHLNDTVLTEEINQLKLDTLNEIIYITEKNYSIYSQFNTCFSCYNMNELTKAVRQISKNRILGQIFDNTFELAPKVNLEMLNRTNVKGTYKKARENVVEKILTNTINYDKLGTSPEDTVINCTLVETGIYNNDVNEKMTFVINEINNFFNQQSACFNELYKTLMSPPYGLRKGIIPIYLAHVIKELNISLIIYYKNQEVDISAELIENINKEPKNYRFETDKASVEKNKYLLELAQLFDVDFSNRKNKYNALTKSMQMWYAKLPKFTKQMIGIDDRLTNRSIRLLKRSLSSTDVNPSDFILHKLPSLFNSETYNIINDLGNVKNELENFKYNYALTDVKRMINNILGFNIDTDLNLSIKNWLFENKEVLQTKILDEGTKKFIELFTKENNYNEYELINKISFDYVGLFIEEWSSKTIDLFSQQFEKILDYLNKNDGENEITLIVNGNEIIKTFNEDTDESSEIVENIIEETFDDYGDLLTNEQKLALLVKIMKKYI